MYYEELKFVAHDNPLGSGLTLYDKFDEWFCHRLRAARVAAVWAYIVHTHTA